MRPPRITDNEIKRHLKITKGKENLILKYPTEGEYRSSFVMYDVDGWSRKRFWFLYLKSDETPC